jgi:hypothetical protein
VLWRIPQSGLLLPPGEELREVDPVVVVGAYPEKADRQRILVQVRIQVSHYCPEFKQVEDAEVRRLFDFLEFKSLHDRLYEALGATGSAPVASTAEVLHAEVRETASAADAASTIEGMATLDIGAAWAGEPGRSALTGLAIVVDPASADLLYAHLLACGKEPTYDRVEGADHGFRIAGTPPVNGWADLYGRVVDWFLKP